MSISGVVARFADALAAHARVTPPPDAALLAALETTAAMPRYVVDARLDLWEEALLEFVKTPSTGALRDAALAVIVADARAALATAGVELADVSDGELADW